jgi:hypothetical protein
VRRVIGVIAGLVQNDKNYGICGEAPDEESIVPASSDARLSEVRARIAGRPILSWQPVGGGLVGTACLAIRPEFRFATSWRLHRFLSQRTEDAGQVSQVSEDKRFLARYP